MATPSNPLSLWHLCSLDAPTVAVTWAWAIASAAHVPLPGWAAASLALIVWTIYLADRLLDARTGLRIPGSHTLRERHIFHWAHRKILLPCAAISALAAAALVFSQLPARSIRPDSLIAAATLVWLTSVHAQRKPIREQLSQIIVAILFTAGCALPACSQLAALHSLPQFWKLPLAALLSCAALAWLNLHSIAQWESLRSTNTRAACFAVAAASLAAALFAPRSETSLLASTVASALLLALLDARRKQLPPLTLRSAADLVLLTPLLVPHAH